MKVFLREIQNNEELKKVILQFLKFGIVGVSNTLISLVVYYFLVFIKVHYIIANTLGFIISVINAYYWNSKYVFKAEKIRNGLKSFIKVFISYGFTFILGTILLFLFVDVFKISNLVAPLINLLITIPLNFGLNKLWAMK